MEIMLRLNSMNNDITYFEIDEHDQEIINIKIVISLYKSLLKESIITEKEYESLVNKICRTFNIN